MTSERLYELLKDMDYKAININEGEGKWELSSLCQVVEVMNRTVDKEKILSKMKRLFKDNGIKDSSTDEELMQEYLFSNAVKMGYIYGELYGKNNIPDACRMEMDRVRRIIRIGILEGDR